MLASRVDRCAPFNLKIDINLIIHTICNFLNYALKSRLNKHRFGLDFPTENEKSITLINVLLHDLTIINKVLV